VLFLILTAAPLESQTQRFRDDFQHARFDPERWTPTCEGDFRERTLDVIEVAPGDYRLLCPRRHTGYASRHRQVPGRPHGGQDPAGPGNGCRGGDRLEGSGQRKFSVSVVVMIAAVLLRHDDRLRLCRSVVSLSIPPADLAGLLITEKAGLIEIGEGRLEIAAVAISSGAFQISVGVIRM
jgi:hypothetical protein